MTSRQAAPVLHVIWLVVVFLSFAHARVINLPCFATFNEFAETIGNATTASIYEFSDCLYNIGAEETITFATNVTLIGHGSIFNCHRSLRLLPIFNGSLSSPREERSAAEVSIFLSGLQFTQCDSNSWDIVVGDVITLQNCTFMECAGIAFANTIYAADLLIYDSTNVTTNIFRAETIEIATTTLFNISLTSNSALIQSSFLILRSSVVDCVSGSLFSSESVILLASSFTNLTNAAASEILALGACRNNIFVANCYFADIFDFSSTLDVHSDADIVDSSFERSCSESSVSVLNVRYNLNLTTTRIADNLGCTNVIITNDLTLVDVTVENNCSPGTVTVISTKKAAVNGSFVLRNIGCMDAVISMECGSFYGSHIYANEGTFIVYAGGPGTLSILQTRFLLNVGLVLGTGCDTTIDSTQWVHNQPNGTVVSLGTQLFTLHVTQSEFEGSVSPFGGAIEWNGPLFAQYCNFSNNVAVSNLKGVGGGAILTYGAETIIDHCSFYGNQAIVGGAILVGDSNFRLSNSAFVYNNANETGGALYALQTAVTLLSGNVFVNNTAPQGEAFICQLGTVNSTEVIVTSVIEFNCIGCGCCQPPSSDFETVCVIAFPNQNIPLTCPNNAHPLINSTTCVKGEHGSTYSPTPFCNPAICPPPAFLPPNSTIVPGSCQGEFGAKCLLDCDDGFILVNVSTGTCNEYGQFVGQNIVCEAPVIPPIGGTSTSSSPTPYHPSHLDKDVILALVIGGGALFLCLVAMTFALWRVFTRRRVAERELTDPLLGGGPAGHATGVQTKTYLTFRTDSSEPLRFELAVDDSVEQIAWDDLVSIRPIAEGGFGTVYHVRQNSSYTDMAMKLIDVQSRQAMEQFMSEVSVHAKLRHPHILPFLGVTVKPDSNAVGLLSPLLKGDLARGVERLSMRDKASSLLGAARGLAYLHARGITHADLKPSNVLLDRSGEAVLCDFGLSGVRAGRGLTARYAAPEVANGRDANFQSDIYSLGCVIVEVMTGVRPYGEQSLSVAVLNTPPYHPPQLAAVGSAALVAVTARCLSRDPAERPLVGEVVEALSSDLAGR